MKGTVFQGDCYTTINDWCKAHTIPDLGQPVIKMRKLRPGKEKDTQGHKPYWQQYSGESFSSQPSKPSTGWDIPSSWQLGSQWGFRSWKHLEKAVTGHNLVSHFFTISFWFLEVGQKNENCWAMEWGMTFLPQTWGGQAYVCRVLWIWTSHSRVQLWASPGAEVVQGIFWGVRMGIPFSLSKICSGASVGRQSLWVGQMPTLEAVFLALPRALEAWHTTEAHSPSTCPPSSEKCLVKYYWIGPLSSLEMSLQRNGHIALSSEDTGTVSALSVRLTRPQNPFRLYPSSSPR